MGVAWLDVGPFAVMHLAGSLRSKPLWLASALIQRPLPASDAYPPASMSRAQSAPSNPPR